MNQVTLVGRLCRTPELFVSENGNKGSFITLAVGRPFKNQDGEYDTDYIDCTLWTNIAENTAEYCKTGDIIGVRGRIQTRLIENDDGTKYKKTEVVAEKVAFLASHDKEKNDAVVEEDYTQELDNNDDNQGKKKKNGKKQD